MDWITACNYVWLVFVAVWLIAAFTSKPVARKQPIVASLAYRVLTLIAVFLLFDLRLPVGFLSVRFSPPSTALGFAGFALTALGVSFAIWARLFLGGNWSAQVTVKQNHELVQRGPYAIARHPIYSGVSLATLGTALALGQVRGLIGFFLSVIAWRMKWGVEEIFMSQQFGEKYAEYKRHVHALIPGIW